MTLPPGEANRRQRERCKKNRKKNQNYNGYKRGRRQMLRDRVNAIKESKPCADCGYYFPACVIDFDHLPGFKKYDTVSRLVQRQVKWETIQKEINKCEAVCRVCHGIRTHIGRDFVCVPNQKAPAVIRKDLL